VTTALDTQPDPLSGRDRLWQGFCPTAQVLHGGRFPAAGEGLLLVFAAASLSDALADADAAFTAQTGIRVRESFAASSVLPKQIEAGAPADVIFPPTANGCG
jgi:ABC-type molybdate transport system substrate-binding protein